ncbi:SusC/RagA family TonB-linked outer membrane protein [Ancylomarina euxinus]|uniref:SusC/RagA family TonB-linked outer membrane protein n=1 Tax=Ancylomarina euxinus TaxID=2283627 RepID=A0A425XZ31_9BACT|nr:SusC/RagA family TonB-linked outer membrane protein [Ancylomarina euxinus]MCZ4695602.1 SusC/RagA family TonB-linked outer membrane protein [Ancylomarina euxinus]MUP15983.1 SusC/RagA family TonB-linked outer membrane protein [Ancylomarina euxinus]RRG20425.1 SusC/RagA family TonB-linked outer membrane protein [Ancylomarina euxinus]
MKKLGKWRCLSPAIGKIARIMKISVFLVLVCSMQLSASVMLGQQVSIHAGEMTVREVFKEFKTQTGTFFMYSEEDISLDLTVDVDFSQVSLEEALQEICKQVALSYEIVDNYVLITKKPSLVELPLQEQKKELKGTVTDSDGNTLPGVSVVVKGTTIGVATDIDGNYAIQFDNENAIMVFSFVGMLRQEVLYTGQAVQNIILLPDSKQVSEVVVTGYQTISKERATGAFEKVGVKVLDEKSTFKVLDKLEGQTSGVLFDESGNMTIRGVSTMNANRDPLVVVDGFPIEGHVETLNPDDIESITVLKDAAAASIWGARAANGVIVIVSKKNGKKGKPRVEFSSSLSMTGEPDLDDQPVVSTASFLEMEKFLADNGWQTMPTGANQYPITQGMDTYLRLNDGQISEAEANQILDGYRKVDVRNEFADLFLRKQVRQHYNLSISGAGEKNNYYMSLGYDDNDNFSKGNDSDRLIANIKISSELSDRISVNAGVSATLRNQYSNGISIGSLGSVSQYQTILDANGDYVPQPQSYYQPTKEALVAQGYPYNWDYNLYQEYQNKDNSIKNTDLRMNFGLNIKLLKGLDFEGRYQYEWGNEEGENLYNEETYNVRGFVNRFTYIDDDGSIVTNAPKGHIFSESFYKKKSYTTRGQLSFNRAFDANKHQINAIAGMEVRKTTSESSSYRKYGYDPQSLQFVSINHNERYPMAISGSKGRISDDTKYLQEEDRFISYYTNTAYTYNDKYTVTASARLDDSNLFGADSKYRNVPLWSTGINWQLHKEDFMTSDLINRLTLRMTYGTNGNVSKTTSPYLIAQVTKDYRDQHQYAYIKNPKNPSLRWEKTAVVNFGLDYALWNNRISGSLEYYSRKSTDLLGNVSLNSTYGFTSALMNFAEMSNKGVDASLLVKLVDKQVKWNTSLNFSYNKNRVEKVEMPDETVSSYMSGTARVGKPLNYMYSYKWAGLSSEGFPQVFNEKGEAIDYETRLDDPTALKYEGTMTPKYYGSLNNVVTYKGFRLSMLMTYKLGYKFRIPTIDYSSLKSSLKRNWVHEDYDKRWQQAGDEAHTDVPVLPANFSQIGGYFGSYSSGASHLVESASHIRFKEVILSYNLPKEWFKSLGINALVIGTQVRNLGVITFNNSGIDPENIPGLGKYGNSNPEYTFSLKATF